MRLCPVCMTEHRNKIFSTPFTPPDGWTLPREIIWYECRQCGMIYGDGDMTQAMFDEYYRTKYGYGVNNPANIERLQKDAEDIAARYCDANARVVDFGGSGDDGKSIFFDTLKDMGLADIHNVNAGEPIFPADCKIIYASHVLEHIYNLSDVMKTFNKALAQNGILIIDVPDATGLLNRWRMPILDFNTKHLNHFTLRTLLELGHKWGFESILVKPYELEFAPCFQIRFRKLDVAQVSAEHIKRNIDERIEKLKAINYPVNIWGMGDIVWVLLSYVDLDVLNYIDNDPAYRGATYKGKPVMEKPDNDESILILSQGQRKRLIENIRKMGIENELIEI